MALLELLKETGSASNEARTADGALVTAVRLVAEHQGWAVGHAYLCAADGTECLPTTAWYVRSGLDAQLFQASTMGLRLRRGSEFAGTVLETRSPLWIPDVHRDARWMRDDAGLGLKSAVFHPVLVQGEVRAVLAFYSDREITPEPALASVMGSVAVQLAQVLERDETARRVTLAAEDEQRQIGQELHDRLGQNLSALGMLARSLQRKIEAHGTPEADELNALIQGIEDAKSELRLVAKGLLPLDLELGGLPVALQDLAARCSQLYRIECRYEGEEQLELRDGSTAIQLFRITQEAVRNAGEHSHASRVTIRLQETDRRLALEVRDDGTGFEGDALGSRGLGLRIMRHRAALVGASLTIASTPGQGTVVRCTLTNP